MWSCLIQLFWQNEQSCCLSAAFQQRHCVATSSLFFFSLCIDVWYSQSYGPGLVNMRNEGRIWQKEVHFSKWKSAIKKSCRFSFFFLLFTVTIEIKERIMVKRTTYSMHYYTFFFFSHFCKRFGYCCFLCRLWPVLANLDVHLHKCSFFCCCCQLCCTFFALREIGRASCRVRV